MPFNPEEEMIKMGLECGIELSRRKEGFKPYTGPRECLDYQTELGSKLEPFDLIIPAFLRRQDEIFSTLRYIGMLDIDGPKGAEFSSPEIKDPEKAGFVGVVSEGPSSRWQQTCSGDKGHRRRLVQIKNKSCGLSCREPVKVFI